MYSLLRLKTIGYFGKYLILIYQTLKEIKIIIEINNKILMEEQKKINQNIFFNVRSQITEKRKQTENRINVSSQSTELM